MEKVFKIYTEKNHVIVKIFGIKLSFNFSIKNNGIYIQKQDGKLKKVRKIPGLKVDFRNSNSKVIVKEPMIRFKKSKAVLGHNCTLTFGMRTKDEVVGVNDTVFLMTEKNSNINIGDDFFYCKRAVAAFS